MKFVLNEIFNYHFGLLNQVEYAKIFQKLRRSSAAHAGDQPWLAENHRLKKSENQKSVNLQFNTAGRRDDDMIVPLSDDPMIIWIDWE